ncbi:hypothetical protein EG68_10286 [Paragonimus skrjabini miyazakii]|uniref:Uncharacterized protein n=1 Tax=Paragonimus skrjabini miyazakii TaxID=59628 RepID=A0A8S9YJ76_9TREM|nr:hypothetical protein EG68_10286 [Paragonimus skrjabini miyazakii]
MLRRSSSTQDFPWPKSSFRATQKRINNKSGTFLDLQKTRETRDHKITLSCQVTLTG